MSTHADLLARLRFQRSRAEDLARVGAVWIVLAGIVGHGAPVAAEEILQAFALGNLNRNMDAVELPAVETPVAVADGLVFTWSSELWVTDSTAAGTRRLCGPDPDLCVRVAMRLDSPPGLLYFLDQRELGEDPALWRTDGTEAGTFPLTDPERVRLQEGSYPVQTHLQTSSGRLFFSAENVLARTGLELWVTDGTAAGTRQVADIADGPLENDSTPLFGADLGDRMVFAARDGNAIHEVWSTDGTPEGTFELLKAVPRSGSFPFGFSTLGDRVVFFTNSGYGGRALWSTDGLREGTTERVFSLDQTKDPFFGFVGPVVGGRVVFLLGDDLWASDGTAEGTMAIGLEPNDSSLGKVVPVGDRALVAIFDDTEADQIWAIDGTPEGTRLLVDPCPGSCNTRPDGFDRIGDRIVFVMEDVDTGRELWISDATPAGTGRLADLCPGPCSSHPEVLGTLGDTLWATADPGDGRELWQVDLSTGEADVLTDLEPGNPFPGPTKGGLLDGNLVFSATDSVQGQALWSSDGSGLGTFPYFVLGEATDAGSEPLLFTRKENEVFFEARTPEHALWATDGTAPGTRRVWNDSGRLRGIERLVRLGGTEGPLLFTARLQDTAGVTLYRSDGTTEGTVPLACDIGPSGPLIEAGDRIFYLAPGSPPHFEDAAIWLSDGTAEGTRKITELSAFDLPGAVRFGRKIVFEVDDTSTPRSTTSLWISDGTAAGTHPLLDDRGQVVRNPRALTVAGADLFFTAEAPDDESLRVIWHSDGTPGGTRVFESPDGSFVTVQMKAVGGRLLFLGQPTAEGGSLIRPFGLWISDGTPEGSRRLAFLYNGFAAVEIDSSLFFVDQLGFDLRLWRSDGTEEGTVSQVLSLPVPALTADLHAIDGHLLLTTFLEEIGHDLWELDTQGEIVALVGRFRVVGRDFVGQGQRVVFGATRRTTGHEPWVLEPRERLGARRLTAP